MATQSPKRRHNSRTPSNTSAGNGSHSSQGGIHLSYGRFAAMIGTSTVTMFGLMYLDTFAWDHVR